MALAGFLTTAQTITGSHSDFPALLVAANFTNANANALDGTTFSNGGGNVIVYTDQTKTTRVPIEVVEFVTGGTPSVQIWAKHPTMQTGATFWIEADSVQVSQPAVTDTFGRNAVWSSFSSVLHLNQQGSGVSQEYLDSSGNNRGGTASVAPTLTSTDHPFGGEWQDLNGINQDLSIENTGSLFNGSDFTISLWCKNDATTAAFDEAVSSNRITSSTSSSYLMSEDDGGVAAAVGSNYNKGSAGLVGTVMRRSLINDQVNWYSRVNGSANVSSLSTAQSSSDNIKVGTYLTTSQPDRHWDGKVGEHWVRLEAISFDQDAAEYDNQNTPSTFWTSSDWTAGGGITVTENTNNTNYTSNDPVVTLTGSISISETLVNSNYTSLNPSISLTGVVSITEATSNANYTSLNPVIDFTGLVSIVESLENTNYNSLDPLITLTSATIKITEQIVGTQYQARPPSILLTPPPLAIVSTVCFDGVIQDLSYDGSLQDLSYNGAINFVEFNGNMKELEFNGTIQISCCDGSIKTDC